MSTARHPNATSQAYGRLPSSVARDMRLSAACLVVLAYRTTYTGRYGLNEKHLGTIASGKGLGINAVRRAIAGAIELGYLHRSNNATLKRTPKGTFRQAVDELTLPDTPRHLTVCRRWFDGSLSVKGLAALLYLHAGSGKGYQLYAREITARFGWSRPTTAVAIRELLAAGLIDQSRRRKGDGTFSGITYRATPALTTLAAAESVPAPHRVEAATLPPIEVPVDHDAVHALEPPAVECSIAPLIEEVRAWDVGGVLALHLLTPRGFRPYLKIFAEHGEGWREVVQAILRREVLGRADVDDDPAGRIRSWGYFVPALHDALRRQRSTVVGLAEGERLGRWRDEAAISDVPF